MLDEREREIILQTNNLEKERMEFDNEIKRLEEEREEIMSARFNLQQDIDKFNQDASHFLHHTGISLKNIFKKLK